MCNLVCIPVKRTASGMQCFDIFRPELCGETFRANVICSDIRWGTVALSENYICEA